MADGTQSNPGLQQDPLVDRLAPDPGQVPADLIRLAGFLGKSTKPGHWRLYLNPELSEYVEVAEADIVHSQANSGDPNAMAGTSLWVRRGASLQHTRVESRQVEAEFLQGDITGSMLAGQTARAPGPQQLFHLPNTIVVSRFCSHFCSAVCSSNGPFFAQPIVTCTHPFNATCCS